MSTSCQREPSISEQDQMALWKIRTKWVGVYSIGLADGVWRAQRFTNPANVITADTAGELGDKITADYASAMTP